MQGNLIIYMILLICLVINPKATGLAYVDVDFYQQVPSIANGVNIVPDYNYSIIINENTSVNTQKWFIIYY